MLSTCSHQGRIFRDASLPDVPVVERSHMHRAVVETLARLHSLDWRRLGLEGFGGKGDFCKRQVATCPSCIPVT